MTEFAEVMLLDSAQTATLSAVNFSEAATCEEAVDAFSVGFSRDILATCADMFELLSLIFAFPTRELVEALASGDLRADVRACLKELGVGDEPVFEIGNDPEHFFAVLRREYSRLYHSPGKLAIIYPYESAFLFVSRGSAGHPTLLANRLTGEVESAMAAAGYLPKTAHREPVDSVWQECDFMRHLLTRALVWRLTETAEGDARAALWLAHAEAFFRDHVRVWMLAFMDATVENTRLPLYRVFAETGRLFLENFESLICERSLA